MPKVADSEAGVESRSHNSPVLDAGHLVSKAAAWDGPTCPVTRTFSSYT